MVTGSNSPGLPIDERKIEVSSNEKLWHALQTVDEVLDDCEAFIKLFKGSRWWAIYRSNEEVVLGVEDKRNFTVGVGETFDYICRNVMVKINGHTTLSTLISVCTICSVSRNTYFCFKVIGLEMSLCQDEEGSMQRTSSKVLLDRPDLPALVLDARIHSLDVEKECGR